ncbi:MAG: hypothetical protein M1816_000546 [Peltula sp. TS41687]|nr:MAG: hypothetical protein M1816_000546 [Peltula sp. TS41687]
MSTPQRWTHTPPLPLLIWLSVSVPLVLWDTAFVFLRPHSLPPDGALHRPFFVPYALYGSVDYLYSRKAYEDQVGFTGAQAVLNAVESTLYLAYLWFATAASRDRERGDKGGGREALGPVLGLVAAAMTLSKTGIYWLNEWFSGWADIRHNSWSRLISYWILPNAFWLIFPTYMLWMLGRDVKRGLEVAAAVGGRKKDL